MFKFLGVFLIIALSNAALSQDKEANDQEVRASTTPDLQQLLDQMSMDQLISYAELIDAQMAGIRETRKKGGKFDVKRYKKLRKTGKLVIAAANELVDESAERLAEQNKRLAEQTKRTDESAERLAEAKAESKKADEELERAKAFERLVDFIAK